MAPTLLVTNDFPPTLGGIQSYLRDFVSHLVALNGPDSVVVFASTQDAAAAREWDAAQPYTIVRWPHRVMLPTPRVRAAMAQLIRRHGATTVWFGAAAPLAVLGGAAKRAGAHRVVATTHGHEVGWSMLPGARQVLRNIGRNADVLTYISGYTRRRIAPAFGTHPEYVALPSGVDTDFFRPAEPAHADREPRIVCASRLVPRKGQDQLIRALPAIRAAVPGTQLVIVGSGPDERRLRTIARGTAGVTFTGAVDRATLRDTIASADVFAMPARTRGGGLDVEGLGIVYLEAQACGVPVIAGDSGGAPETVTPATGVVVDGTSLSMLADATITLLSDPAASKRMGEAGRVRVEKHFAWDVLTRRLAAQLK